MRAGPHRVSGRAKVNSWIGRGLCFSLGMLSAGVLTAQTVLLSGTVVDAHSHPAAGAKVALRGPDAEATTTDSSGRFTLRAGEQAGYKLTADTPDRRHGELDVDGAKTGLTVVLSPSPAAQLAFEFTDKPDFTVAGITDWTAVGGHGSDATLRTSEELAREAAALHGGSEETTFALDTRREAELRKAFETQPENYEANHALGMFYVDAQRFAEAGGYLERAALLHGHAAADEYAAARACAGEGDLQRARGHLAVALAKGDDVAKYHAFAGEFEERLGNPLEAARQEQRAAELDPSEANYFVWGAELLLHRAILQASQVFAKGVHLYPESQRLKTGWGAALFAEARYDEAAGQLCEASDEDPDNRETYLFLGKLALGSPEPATCVRERLARFLKRFPGDAQANFYQAMLELKSGDPAGATNLLQHAAALDPSLAEADLQLGILASGRHDNVEAERYLKLAIAADPSQAEAHYRLAVLFDRSGQTGAAKVEYATHERLAREQAEAVEQERRQVKQFVMAADPGAGKTAP